MAVLGLRGIGLAAAVSVYHLVLIRRREPTGCCAAFVLVNCGAFEILPLQASEPLNPRTQFDFPGPGAALLLQHV